VDALREKVLSSKELIREVQQSGVAFDLTSTEEADIRSAGKYLGKKGLDELIAAIKRNSKRPTMIIRANSEALKATRNR